MFLATGPEGILGGGPAFFEKEHLSNFFCGQNEENISHHVTKIIIWVMYSREQKFKTTTQK